MPYILDAIVLVILALAVFFGYRHGLIRSLIQLIGCVAAFLLALSLSSTVATLAYDHVLQEPLHQKIESVWEDTVINGAAQTLSEQTTALAEALPSFARSLLDTDALCTYVEQSVGNRETGAAVADYLSGELLKPIVVSVVRVAAFLILFVVLLLVTFLLGRLIKPLVKLPVIRQTDGLLGMLLGLVKGVMFVLAFVSIVQLIAAGSTNGLLTEKTIEDSCVVSWIASHNPLFSLSIF